tara:strand:- start:54 stop:617 length:564 start_codon:yes stop_codon:yes gene_type:complete
MCDVNGPFKLCTCSEKIDKKKPYWVLKSNREDNIENMVLGMFSQPNIIFTPIVRRNILTRLNSVKSIFDFDYKPKERDLLKLCGEYDEYYFEFKGGKWIWLENFNYIGKDDGTFKSKKRGYIEGKQSELMRVLEEYKTITKISLYDDNDFGVRIPKNEFEEKLYSKKINQKEVIKMIQEEIDRLNQI